MYIAKKQLIFHLLLFYLVSLNTYLRLLIIVVYLMHLILQKEGHVKVVIAELFKLPQHPRIFASEVLFSFADIHL